MNVKNKLKDNLPKELYRLLERIGRSADTFQCKVYCVGGFVRDLLLGVENFDIDITVEGNGIDFAKYLAQQFSEPFVAYKKFGTATVFMTKPLGFTANSNEKPFKIDIATAREEKYKKPAILPNVKYSSIKKDLRRRDFTINAMAFSLNKSDYGELIDFYEGFSDLKNGIIRSLHELSFIDDPTRIFRAVRFEQRYNFRIESKTLKLIKKSSSLKMLEKTQKHRIGNELALMLNEKNPEKYLLRIRKLYGLGFIDSKMDFDITAIKIFKKINNIAKIYKDKLAQEKGFELWLVYFMAMVSGIEEKSVEKICRNFCFNKRHTIKVVSAGKNADKIRKFLDKEKNVKISEIFIRLEPLPAEVVIFIMALCQTRKGRRRIICFLNKQSSYKININGADLMNIGIQPGPIYKKILLEITKAKIDGIVKTKKEEILLAKKLAE